MKKNNANIVTAEEALEILNKPWCTAEDIMKLSGYGENKAAKVRKEINEKLNIMLKVIEKVSENSFYSKKLMNQMYCDLNLPVRDVNSSNNLNEFTKKYYGKKRKLNE